MGTMPIGRGAAQRLIDATTRRHVRGLLDPNPGGIGRATKPTEVLASGVTVSATVASTDPMNASAVSAASTIANSRPVVWSDPLWDNLTGKQMAPYGAAYPDNLCGAPANYVTNNPNRLATDLEFEHYGRFLEVGGKYINTGSKYRLWVDDQPVGPPANPSGNTLFLMPVDFGAVGLRRIRLQFDGVPFAGVRVGPNDDLGLSPLAPKTVMAVLSDSYGAGTGGTWPYSAWSSMAAKLLGIKRLLNVSVGGTGLLNVGTSSSNTFRGRIAADLIPLKPDLILIAGGYNDSGFSDAAIQAEAGLLIDTLRAALPNATVIFVGCWTNSGTPTAKMVTIRDAERAACDARKVPFIDVINGPYPYSGTLTDYVDKGWVRGTGYAGAVTGIGTGDLFRYTDGQHPSAAGHDWLGRYIARKIFALLPI